MKLVNDVDLAEAEASFDSLTSKHIHTVAVKDEAATLLSDVNLISVDQATRSQQKLTSNLFFGCDCLVLLEVNVATILLLKDTFFEHLEVKFGKVNVSIVGYHVLTKKLHFLRWCASPHKLEKIWRDVLYCYFLLNSMLLIKFVHMCV